MKKFSQKATMLAYELPNLQGFSNGENTLTSGFLENNWQILRQSVQDKSTNENGYKALAFVNHASKKIHIATAGTKHTDTDDLIDDVIVSQRCVPYKITQAKNMVTKSIESLGGIDKAAEYTFSTSGHSLGAIMSDLTAAEIISRDLKFDKSTTFENPGSKEIVIKAAKKGLLSGKTDSTILDKLSEHAEVYNAKPNFINSCGTQLGKVHLAFSYTKKNTTSNVQKTTKAISYLWGFGNYLYDIASEAAFGCSEYLGIKSFIDQIEGHKLENFEKISSYDIVDHEIEGVAEKQLVLKNSEKLRLIPSTGKDVVTFIEINDCDLILLNKVEYSFDDLELIGDAGELESENE